MSEVLEKLEQEARAKAQRVQDEFAVKVGQIKERVAGLEREKSAIQNGRVSKAEAVQRMKADLKNGVDQFVKAKFVAPVLRTYASGHYRPLQNFDHMKTHLLAGTEWLFFVFGWVTPEMVDQAAEKLEEGPTEAERRKKVEEIDREIVKAEKELEGLLR